MLRIFLKNMNIDIHADVDTSKHILETILANIHLPSVGPVNFDFGFNKKIAMWE